MAPNTQAPRNRNAEFPTTDQATQGQQLQNSPTPAAFAPSPPTLPAPPAPAPAPPPHEQTGQDEPLAAVQNGDPVATSTFQAFRTQVLNEVAPTFAAFQTQFESLNAANAAMLATLKTMQETTSALRTTPAAADLYRAQGLAYQEQHNRTAHLPLHCSSNRPALQAASSQESQLRTIDGFLEKCCDTKKKSFSFLASEQNRKAAAKMTASVMASFDVVRAGCASAAAASSVHQPSVDCSVPWASTKIADWSACEQNPCRIADHPVDDVPRHCCSSPPAVSLARIVPFGALRNMSERDVTR